ncbi:MAG: EAL domain-containing protein [Candidatus Nitronauta litoralis]|uniref:EAL domain-containing protein n=1 Tax=Candidatus Nitronauta litoralis TaxID=2705533 RepID=A0A7T0G1K8_9BACT|nr:MAG: EAL domain-containing protein [Candidatus Nitronauta litoralis]
MEVSQLKEIELFQYLPDEVLEELITISSLIHLDANETLFEEGDPGETIYAVISGRLALYKEGQEIALIWQGQFFGEMAVIEEKPRSATIIASSESQLMEIPNDFFQKLLVNHHSFFSTVLTTMCQRVRGNLQDLALGYHKIKSQEQLSSQIHQIIDSSPSEILIFDFPSGRLVRSNTAAVRRLGYLPMDIQNLTIYDLIKDLSKGKFISQMDQIIAGKQNSLKFQALVNLKNDEEYITDAIIQPMGHSSESLFIAIFKDKNGSKPLNGTGENQNNYDSLTGLPNRNLVNDRIQFFQAYAERHDTLFAIIVLDIDNFKTLNEGLGPKAGDELLKLIANRLVQCLRKEDTVARLGGDEFLILLNIKEEGDASRMGKKLMRLFEQTFSIEKEEVRVGASVGIALFPYDGKDPVSLLMGADAAMHRAKEHGKRTYQFYNSSLLTKAANQLKIENALYRGLEQDEFVLYYQPKVSTKNFQIMGVEALLRWNHPEKGLVPPGEFIPVAESSRLIVPLGEWILKTACKAIKEWRDLGLNEFTVAVNISGYQFNHSNILQTVDQALKSSAIDPAGLELELTESILLDDTKGSLNRINQMRDMGLQLAIDDFGTGYSSLTYLRDLPINNLKIDRSFIHNLRHQRNLAIVKAIITLAKTLKLKTIAEGVEEEEERKLLGEMNCDQIQGYLYSRPIPHREMTALLKNSIELKNE